jgi:hypothetical protein
MTSEQTETALERVHREREERRLALLSDPAAPRHFFANVQVFAEVEVQDGKVVRVVVAPDLDVDVLDSVTVEGVGTYHPELQTWTEGDAVDWVPSDDEVPDALAIAHGLALNAPHTGASWEIELR